MEKCWAVYFCPSSHARALKTATEQEIKEFVNSKVAPYKAVREVEFRTELPMTLVGKVLRRVLQEEERKKTVGTQA